MRIVQREVGDNYDVSDEGACKASLTSADDLLPEIPPIRGPRLRVTINARCEAGAEELRSAMQTAIERSARSGQAAVHITEEQSFHPSRPVPFERIP
jgi:hypothetical protein